MKERILIFGNGQIGNFYLKHFRKESLSVKIAKANITDVKQIERAIGRFEPTIIINTAAKTNLEWCAKHKLEAFSVNVLGADNIAQICDRSNIYFIHFSSGCIFQSKNKNDAKKEDDAPNPAAYYAWTKVWSEQLIQFEKSKDFKYLILRPRQPVSAQLNYKNILVKFLTFTRFIDTPNTGTVIEDLIQWTDLFIKKKPIGILHVANEGFSTPYKIALLLKKYILPSLKIKKISKKELDQLTPIKRVDTVLSVDKLRELGIEPKPYRTRLKEIIIELGQNIKKADREEIRKQMNKTLAQSRTRTIVNSCWKDLLKV